MLRVQIQPGVPIPPHYSTGSKRGYWREIFSKMKVGDSFFVPRRHFSMHNHYAKVLGHKYTARRQSDGMRVWRVA